MESILKLEGICKSYGGVKVLKNIDLEIRKGEVMAILGANGAGKSTLIKIIGGAHRPDGGKLFLNGTPLEVSSPNEARSKGIAVIYQELSLVPTMDAVSNVFLGREKHKNGILDKKEMEKVYKEIGDLLDFDIPIHARVNRLSIAQQQMLEIMKAVSTDSRIVIMDEPTTSLTESEKNKLFEIILNLRRQGKTILYISHMLDEVLKIADRITVLKDGLLVGTYNTEEIDKRGIIAKMTGRDALTDITVLRERRSYKAEPVVMAVSDLSLGKKLKKVSFKLYKGEILGLAGLVGSGRTELCMSLFGAEHGYSGDIYIEGKKVGIKSPLQAINSGIGLVPEDRKNLGLIQLQEVYKNATVIQLKRMLKRGCLSRKSELAFMQSVKERLGIKLAGPFIKVRSLSGGNQQKVVVSKWLDMALKIIIFDEPTKGIDVAAKEDIFRIIVDFANKGMGVIFVSSDLEEVARLSDRVLVLHNGRIVRELEMTSANTAEIGYAVLHG